jgi:hypothetical protein
MITDQGMRWDGFGGITDSNLQSAATALLEDLRSSGCTNGFDQYVADFQTAWNAANAGNPLVLSNGTPGADGYYGANTQAALQATLNASGIVNQAPTGCVAAAPGSSNATGGGGAAVVPVVPVAPPPPPPLPGPTPGPSTTVTKPSPSNAVLWVVGGATVAALTTTYLVYKKKVFR